MAQNSAGHFWLYPLVAGAAGAAIAILLLIVTEGRSGLLILVATVTIVIISAVALVIQWLGKRERRAEQPGQDER